MQEILSSIRPRTIFLSGLVLVPLAVTLLLVTPITAQDTKSDQPAAAESLVAAQPQEEPVAAPPEESTAPARVFNINWDATIKYTSAFRVTGQNATLIDATETNAGPVNSDDGDRAFNVGPVTDRGDIFTEVDLTYGNFGIHSSAAGWGDAAYLGTSANNSPETYNGDTVNYNQWTEGTRDLSLGHAELLDAFAFAKFNIGNSTLSLRGGQYALQWGESLFFGSNGIAGGMAPIDLLKLLGVPNAQFKEIIRPVPQVSMQYQVTPAFAIGAYYQLMWQATRLPPPGNYYSFVDLIGEGNERLLAGAPVEYGPNMYTGPLSFLHGTDRLPKNSGQFGVQVKFRLPDGWDAGVYGIQYHEKGPQLYMQPFASLQIPSGQLGNYYWVYPENVKAFAVSTTKTHGDVNYAMELGVHFHQDLVSDGPDDLSLASGGHVPAPDSNNNAGYAIGTTVHGNVSWLASLGPSHISKEASWRPRHIAPKCYSSDRGPQITTIPIDIVTFDQFSCQGASANARRKLRRGPWFQ